MILKLCACAGCGGFAVSGSPFCARHKAEADRRPRQLFRGTRRNRSAPYHHLYECARWKAVRRAQLERSPFCAVCGAKAAIADHIVPHKGDESLFFNEGNVQSLCWKCHSAKTLAENNYFKKPRNR